MNADQEDFESLKKLLALKKHEQPPPGYFNELPRKIWIRIEAEENKAFSWGNIFGAIGMKPSVAYAFGLVICGTLIIGIGSALKTEQVPPLAGPFMTQEASGPIISATPSAAINPTYELSSTNPVINSEPFYPGPPKLQVAPAAFNP